MAGKDKTSWLDGLEHDDEHLDGLEAESDRAPFTEAVGAVWEKTDAGLSEGKTELLGAHEDDKTRIAIAGLDDDATEFVEDPVTGWLVVIEGPGKGRAVAIGAGLNRIGRATSERVALPFGDRLISSEDHLRIIYDDEERNFLVVPGTGKNLSRLDGRVIATPMPLETYAVLQLSKATKVRFAAFCGAGFDWGDTAGDAGEAKPGTGAAG